MTSMPQRSHDGQPAGAAHPPCLHEDATDRVRASVDAIYRADARRVLATLIRLLGDIDRAEEALHEAFTVAVEQWSRQGVPANPRAWLISTGRFKAIDGMRRRARFDASLTALTKQLETSTSDAEVWDDKSIEDDQLRLIFTCCHPALPPEAQVAMTLSEVCGLTTDEIARAFLTKPPTISFGESSTLPWPGASWAIITSRMWHGRISAGDSGARPLKSRAYRPMSVPDATALRKKLCPLSIARTLVRLISRAQAPYL